MKRTFAMIGVVAAYSLLEAGLLLNMLVVQGYSNSISCLTAAVSLQLLVIPGLAVAVSRILYGPQNWRRRALVIFGLGSLGVPVLILLLVAVGILLEWVSSITWASTGSIVLFAVFLVMVGTGITTVLVLVIKKGAARSVRLETARWLDERRSAIDPLQRTWRRRAIRLAPWVPVMTVLFVFLFLPEIWGILSHLSQPQARNLCGYRVPIPVTWIVLGHDNQQADGQSSVMGLTSRGMGFDPTPYLHADFPLSTWAIGTEPYREGYEPPTHSWMRGDDTITGQRGFTVGTNRLTCMEYSPSYMRRPPHVPSSLSIDCSGSIRLYARFVGRRDQVPIFYGMLEGVTQTNSGGHF